MFIIIIQILLTFLTTLCLFVYLIINWLFVCLFVYLLMFVQRYVNCCSMNSTIFALIFYLRFFFLFFFSFFLSFSYIISVWVIFRYSHVTEQNGVFISQIFDAYSFGDRKFHWSKISTIHFHCAIIITAKCKIKYCFDPQSGC